VVPGHVKLTFALDLPRELAERLSARAIRQGVNTASRICATKDDAKAAHDQLGQDLRRRARQAEESGIGLAPATVRQLFEAYVADLEARGKGPDSTYGHKTATGPRVVIREPNRPPLTGSR